MQETLIRAWKNAGQLNRATGSVRPWLVTVARRIVIDGHRSRQARPQEVDPSPLEVIPAEDEIDKALWLMTLSDALDDLTPAHREVLGRDLLQGAYGQRGGRDARHPQRHRALPGLLRPAVDEARSGGAGGDGMRSVYGGSDRVMLSGPGGPGPGYPGVRRHRTRAAVRRRARGTSTTPSAPTPWASWTTPRRPPSRRISPAATGAPSSSTSSPGWNRCWPLLADLPAPRAPPAHRRVPVRGPRPRCSAGWSTRSRTSGAAYEAPAQVLHAGRGGRPDHRRSARGRRRRRRATTAAARRRRGPAPHQPGRGRLLPAHDGEGHGDRPHHQGQRDGRRWRRRPGAPTRSWS